MGTNAKTPLLRLLCSAFHRSLHVKQDKREFESAFDPSRRGFVKLSLAATGVMAAGFWSPGHARPSPFAPRIAIVGGGLAGLNAAYQLRKAGHRATIYEASSGNAWGRIQTRYASNGLMAELGGEFIDSNHTDMLRLAREFRLPLIDIAANVRQSRVAGDTFFFNGREVSEAEVVREFRPVAKKIAVDAAKLPESITYRGEDVTPEVTRLDHTSIEQYLSDELHLSPSDLLYRLLTAAYTSEFGLETNDQSALNLLTMIDTDVRRGFKVFGDSDERFRLRDGNHRLIEALTERLGSQIETGRKLEAIRPLGSGYSLHFVEGREVVADFVVLALPFSMLRGVDLILVELSPKKRSAITDLGYGTNAKLLVDVSSRAWRAQSRSGYLFNEVVQNGWDNSLGQRGDRGLGGYTVFLGGEAGRKLAWDRIGYDAPWISHDGETDTTPPTPFGQNPYLKTLDRVFPKFLHTITSTQVANWTTNPFARGSYAAYRPGQWTTLAGAEAEPAGNIFFCGEHCSADFQGFMNGAAQTGREAAVALMRRVRNA
jgi:monoamine oxidase